MEFIDRVNDTSIGKVAMALVGFVGKKLDGFFIQQHVRQQTFLLLSLATFQTEVSRSNADFLAELGSLQSSTEEVYSSSSNTERPKISVFNLIPIICFS